MARAAARIEKRRVVRGECWESDFDQSKRYPQIRVAGKKLAVHRVYYEAVCGSIPNGAFVLHRCDNPRCHRPDHLFLGSQSDNMRDMVAKRRWRGPQEAVACAFVPALALFSQEEIAQCLGLSQPRVSAILRKAGLGRGRHTSFGKGHGRGGRK